MFNFVSEKMNKWAINRVRKNGLALGIPFDAPLEFVTTRKEIQPYRVKSVVPTYLNLPQEEIVEMLKQEMVYNLAKAIVYEDLLDFKTTTDLADGMEVAYGTIYVAKTVS